MQKIIYILCLAFGVSQISNAQSPKPLTSVEIHNKIKKLNFLGSVLYLAAHPDDENTRLISYLSNKVHARTGYLSLTRGDGGQNLIGSELREQLGVLRTQELLAARGVDGGEQFFSRANDFGYSKHPEETFNIWDKDDVLHDVVWTIRKFRPDIIVNRFDHRSPGTTHGHHTASAMLAMEAFDIAKKKSTYSNQLEFVQPWQPKRIFFNTSWWFYGSQEKFEAADKSNMLSVDIGTYYPELGLSNNEIASMSRSQHKCQGFGTLNVRGEQLEYLELLKGKYPKTGDLFEGINTTWTRIKGGEAILEILQEIEEKFNFQNPEKHLDQLIEAYGLIQSLEDEHWKSLKTKEILEIIEACSGLFIDPVAKTDVVNPTETQKISIELIQRMGNPIALKDVLYQGKSFGEKIKFTKNVKEQVNIDITISGQANYSAPYWLEKESTLGMYRVDQLELIGLPETPNAQVVEFVLEYKGVEFRISKPILYKYADPAIGEIYEPFQVLPEVSTSIKEDVYIFNSEQSKVIDVDVKSWKDHIHTEVQLEVPSGWSVEPQSIPVDIEHKGEHRMVQFTVTPPTNQSEGVLKALVLMEGKTFEQEVSEINYDHIPKQYVLSSAESKVVKLDIKKAGERIGYIKGSGDVTVESLEHIGYKVVELSLEDIQPEYLKQFDAIVIGIRAYNVLEELDFKQDILFDFVKQGGNMIVQYNTNHRLKTERIAPYRLKLSRDRVTDEHAEITFLSPKHPVLNYPNKITQEDFNGWVQERGLYFPNEWDNAFTPIFSMNDKGETEKKGSLLVAEYGKGYYVYTGISFFREFPAGVSGAYRLFANLVSLDQDNK